MNRSLLRILPAIAISVAPGLARAQQLTYPATARGDVSDNYAGRTVADPYRWLENLDSAATKQWVESENVVTSAYLDKLPQRGAIRDLLTALWDYPKVQVPLREAGRLYFRQNSGLQKQSVLFSQASLTAQPRELLDPNVLSPDGSVAVAGWSVSPDGKRVAYTTAEGGSDLQDIHLRDVATGRDLDEVVSRVKFTGLTWTRDSKGFYYARFKGSSTSANLQDANSFHQIWYHAIGSADDRLVFDRPDNPGDFVGAGLSDDGRWLFASAGSGTSNNRLWMADLGRPRQPNLSAPFTTVAPDEDAIYGPLGVVGRTLYLYTTWNAERGKIVAVPVGDSTRSHWRDVVPESPDVISETLLVGNRLVIVYLVDVQSRLRLFDLTGKAAGEVHLPEAGSVAGLSGRNEGGDLFFGFSSYLRPNTVYRYDLKTATLSPFHPTRIPFDASGYETRATFFQSKDGTRVPIFITARKGIALDGSHPTLLYGYGGFDISLQPGYSPARAAWL